MPGMDPVVEYNATHRSWIREIIIGIAVKVGSDLLTDAAHVVAHLLGSS
ncbi:DUF6408 family protein [Streptomyces celluloflavus]